MTTDTLTKTITDEQVLTVLDKLAMDHPGRYVTGQNTDHKRAAGLHYSYDDCIVGALLRELAPDLLAEFLQFELENKNGFSIVCPVGDTARDLLAELKARVSPRMYALLGDAQQDQDAGVDWRHIVRNIRSTLA